MLLLIWLTICGTTVASEQNLIFMVPTFIQPGSNFSVEVHSKGLRWEIPLFGAILDGNGRAVEAANTTVTPDGVAHIRIKIPQGISQTTDYTFSCRPSTQEFKMALVEQHLRFRKDEYFFIQTDKFIYKGGQTVRFRVISLNEYLLPSTSRLNITIQDPKGQKVNEWIKATPIEGVFTKAFELVDQPSFGIWSITSSDGIKVATANIKVMDFCE
ncbi:CD109 antigen-like [Haliotis cracherodii]|uniref:CD109 antigen-like n=1 Tax=Haliotis cracherodii TaxID=6455 RepID=UPI0039ED1453